MKKLILIDGNAVLHRAYHAIPPFRTSTGELVNAIYGFSSILLNLLNEQKPDYIAVSFDLAKKTFRHEQYKEYKATRKKAPDDLYEQLPKIKEVVKTFEIPIFEVEGFEADDVLGTLAAKAEKLDEIKTYIFTGDLDTLQLVTDKTNVLVPKKGLREPFTYTVQKVLGKYGVGPHQIPDLKGLQGDASDNIKGVQGVGAKTASTLLKKYGNLETLYENLDDLKGKVKENLMNDRESAFFSRKLATIVKDVPLEFKLKNCTVHEFDMQKVENLFQAFEFKSLLKRLHDFFNHSEQKKIEEQGSQQSLF